MTTLLWKEDGRLVIKNKPDWHTKEPPRLSENAAAAEITPIIFVRDPATLAKWRLGPNSHCKIPFDLVPVFPNRWFSCVTNHHHYLSRPIIPSLQFSSICFSVYFSFTFLLSSSGQHAIYLRQKWKQPQGKIFGHTWHWIGWPTGDPGSEKAKVISSPSKLFF